MAVCVGVDESVVVSFTVNDWAVAKVCVMELPVPDVPSPKFQVIEYGGVPPTVVAVNVTGMFTIGLAGRNVKPVDGGGGKFTATVLELAAVCDGDEESVAVSDTVNDCAFV
jgi:hypothetical protein